MKVLKKSKSSKSQATTKDRLFVRQSMEESGMTQVNMELSETTFARNSRVDSQANQCKLLKAVLAIQIWFRAHKYRKRLRGLIKAGEEPILSRTMFLCNSYHKVVVFQHSVTSLLLKVIKMPEGFSDDLYVDLPQDQNRFVSRIELIE